MKILEEEKIYRNLNLRNFCGSAELNMKIWNVVTEKHNNQKERNA